LLERELEDAATSALAEDCSVPLVAVKSPAWVIYFAAAARGALS
jgi:hypothetical protein